MPTPFMCHECDGYTMNESGVCDNCGEDMREEEKIRWLTEGLESIYEKSSENVIKLIARAYLDGEPTTADSYNKEQYVERFTSALDRWEKEHWEAKNEEQGTKG